MNPVNPIQRVRPLGFQWGGADPFLFCVHHDDHYPAGDDRLGPAASLEGRDIGQDFAGKDGWRMYHGAVVPGFPQHPHRGFETVTIVRRGYIDHSDSLGAAARFGQGDVQWLTAGAGISHSEMFPLLDRSGPNPVELFQIWLNLPAADKMAPPHFSIFWHERIPRLVSGEVGRATEVMIIAGEVGGLRALAPPPRSYAARAEADLAILTIRMDPGARFTLPAAAAGTQRTAYFFRGSELSIGEQAVPAYHAAELRGDVDAALANHGTDEAELLILQGRPIAEPVASYGPFVMNNRTELQRAFSDYQRTRFGGWPWPSDDPVHGRDAGRFARHADGRVEHPGAG